MTGSGDGWRTLFDNLYLLLYQGSFSCPTDVCNDILILWFNLKVYYYTTKYQSDK